MPKRNAFLDALERQHNAELQTAYETGVDIGYQQAMDYMSIALHSPEVMTKPMGGEAIDKICCFACKLQRENHPAFEIRNPEADVYQDRLDRAQREIFGDKAQPFYERYPRIKKIKY